MTRADPHIMNCENCGHEIELRKSLRRGKSARPDECPNCGSEIEKQDRSNLRLTK